jgi:hypothetical protein
MDTGGGLEGQRCGKCGKEPAALGRAWCWECLEDHMRWLTHSLRAPKPVVEDEGAWWEREQEDES